MARVWLRKALAREVLVLFTCVIVFFGAWGALALRNKYYERRWAREMSEYIGTMDQIAPVSLVQITDPEVLNAPEVPIPYYGDKIVYGPQMKDILLMITLCILGLAFGIRYGAKSVIWAIRTLSAEENGNENFK